MSLTSSNASDGLVAVQVCGQSFGVPVLRVQDVINRTAMNRVPLAPPEVAGSLNLRGRIVTAVDMRPRLGLPARTADETFMCVIVEKGGELYALLVDDVGDVLWLGPEAGEATPATLSQHWRSLCPRLYRLDGELLLALDVDQLLNLGGVQLAA